MIEDEKEKIKRRQQEKEKLLRLLRNALLQMIEDEKEEMKRRHQEKVARIIKLLQEGLR